MKGKRYTTEDKIRILREADTGKTVQEVCRDHNIAEQSCLPLEAAVRHDGDR
jgi:transposase-like protein